MLFKRILTAFLVTVAAFTIGSATYAYAASNTVPARKAGDGAGVIIHYDTIVPQYVLDSADPQSIASVNFNLSADAATVKIKLNASSTTWYTCSVTHSSPWPVSCTTTGATVQNADQFRVFATSN